MDIHLDHDQTLLALIHGKHVTQINALRLVETAPDPAPGILQETDLLFVSPKSEIVGFGRLSLRWWRSMAIVGVHRVSVLSIVVDRGERS